MRNGANLKAQFKKVEASKRGTRAVTGTCTSQWERLDIQPKETRLASKSKKAPVIFRSKLNKNWDNEENLNFELNSDLEVHFEVEVGVACGRGGGRGLLWNQSTKTREWFDRGSEMWHELGWAST
ncbi:hypothetical protein KQX54_018720 [Cotesia glomerata]|uniref:Uncharacterized protein n=1 Tax=Cotesia glomerata TaxID=32391 RepID=A0AAV7I473_COTGL|nr:hypothetical protein KQX54_018720 [Cotesia glomerata]